MPEYVHTRAQGHILAQERVPVRRILHAHHATEQMWVDYINACSLHVIDLLIADSFIRCKCYGALERLFDISLMKDRP